MKAYMELVNNMLLTAEVHADQNKCLEYYGKHCLFSVFPYKYESVLFSAVVHPVVRCCHSCRGLVGLLEKKIQAFIFTSLLMNVFVQITRPRYSSPYSWPLSSFLAYQKQWEVRRKMNAIGWGGKTLEQVRNHFSLWFYCNTAPQVVLLPH